MRLLSFTVGRNETQRYLRPMLQRLSTIVDGMFFYDDDSTDATTTVAQDAGCNTSIRSFCPGRVPTFMEHEGFFRQGAWDQFEKSMHPREDDWVLAIDCDEFLVTRSIQTVKQAVVEEIVNAVFSGRNSIMLDIHEVFGLSSEGTPLVRVDRLWGTIHAPRLFRYRYGGQYANQKMGVPAVPTYVMAEPFWTTHNLALLHYGYAREEDQKAKYERYTTSPEGHSSKHVQSIMVEDKTLIPWDGSVPGELQ